MAFEFHPLDLREVLIVRGNSFADERGFFKETYKLSDFKSNGISQPFVQDSCSESQRGVIRGLHFQNPPAEQGKLVIVLAGEIFDVAVDLRAGSPDYGRWTSTELGAHRNEALWVPSGFAHGFCVLSETALVMYKMTAEYDESLYSGIRWNDPEIGITWPVQDPLVSDKDRALPFLSEVETYFPYP